MAYQQKFELVGLKRMSVESVTVKELTGRDEDAARFRSANDMARMSNELIAQSIIEVDGSPVEPPFHGFIDWSSRTLDVVRRCFNEVNSVSPEEAEDPIRRAQESASAAQGTGDTEQPATP
jgi:hypothetical protein